jgi:hypothetical protein
MVRKLTRKRKKKSMKVDWTLRKPLNALKRFGPYS